MKWLCGWLHAVLVHTKLILYVLPSVLSFCLQLLNDVSLTDKRETLARDLSGGQKRKLCLAMALIGDPKIVFLDEPTAGMDSSARRDVWELLLRKKEGKCIILCTHMMDEADILGECIHLLFNHVRC